METHQISPAARQVESQLEQKSLNLLQAFVKDETGRSLEARGLSLSEYDVYAIRRHKLAGDQIMGPIKFHVGNYSEEVLYGAAGSQMTRFRSALQALALRAESISLLDPEQTEYGHQATLFWAELGRLKEFLTASPVISEMVAELRTARFQFLGTDTPVATMRALSSALHLGAEAKRFDTPLVDQMVDLLEAGGVDPLAPDRLRQADE